VTFQSSPFDQLREALPDFVNGVCKPRTASWAKFSRPSGPKGRIILPDYVQAEARTYQPVPASTYLASRAVSMSNSLKSLHKTLEVHLVPAFDDLVVLDDQKRGSI
jgi:hypothetical protein